jgi:hypothetical protein
MALIISSCAASYTTVKQSSIPLAQYGKVTFLPIDESKFWERNPELLKNGKWPYEVKRSSSHIEIRVAEYCNMQWKGNGPKELIIQTELFLFNPGSRALRYWVGFGAGKGTIGYHIYLKDAATDELVAQFDAYGTIVMGIFGGDVGSAYDKSAQAIIRFLEDNL